MAGILPRKKPKRRRPHPKRATWKDHELPKTYPAMSALYQAFEDVIPYHCLEADRVLTKWAEEQGVPKPADPDLIETHFETIQLPR